MKKHQNVELDQPTPPKFQFDDMELQLKQRARRNFSVAAFAGSCLGGCELMLFRGPDREIFGMPT